jgi:hypothetical protein
LFSYGQILKFFQAYFSLKKIKIKIASFSCFKKNGYRNQFMISH